MNYTWRSLKHIRIVQIRISNALIDINEIFEFVTSYLNPTEISLKFAIIKNGTSKLRKHCQHWVYWAFIQLEGVW